MNQFRVLELMGRILLASFLVFAATAPAISGVPLVAQESPSKPNIVMILADDMRYDDLRYMPKTKSLLGTQGMTFTTSYTPYGSCCPSRTTVLRGQYVHNHKVWYTDDQSPQGGWHRFKEMGYQQDNVAVRLHDAGYGTGLFGKYLNGYEGTTVPPGWDDWFAKESPDYLNYSANDNGKVKSFGGSDGDYATDVISKKAQSLIDRNAAMGKPFFAFITPGAPHEPSTPASRHKGMFQGEQAPRPPSFNEADVSDKPSFIKNKPSLTADQIEAIDQRHRNRAETLQALDELVEAVVDELSASEVLENTYLVFTSDNGWHHGEHRISAHKGQPYEESVHMPLLVRGPGITPGSTTDKIIMHQDFFPTFAEVSGIATPSYVDGRSLVPVFNSTATRWRSAFLLERKDPKHLRNSFFGISNAKSAKYVEYRNGERELYNLANDPYELENIYAAADPTLVSALDRRLEALKRCAGESCRMVEDGA
jgi:N-acetylglucosamine-6-sulfatase